MKITRLGHVVLHDDQGEAAVGLHHVAFKIGTTLDQLREARATFQRAGVVTTSIDHDVTKSLDFRDPDGNGVEVYVDVSDAWRLEPRRIAHAKPFDP
jgi:catechol-2,3-dioxygenase